jgi:diadenosine tetraphosphate (Ap4A) HIT family hydrolase
MPSLCIFCEIAAARESASVVLRDRGVLAFSADAPVNPGHLAAVTLFLADGEAASQIVPHVHLHVIPRFAGDGFKLNPRGGVTTWENLPSRDELDATARAVRAALLA